jgi:hypothetical protein
MRKILYVSVALAATLGGALLIAAPAQAAATAVLFTTTGGGTNVPVNATLNAALKTGTTANFTAGSGTVKCSASTFTAKVVTNPAAGGTATESLTGQTFSSCTATGIAGVTGVQSVTVNGLPYNASVNGTTKAVALTGSISALVKLSTILGTVNCTYTANGGAFNGTASNTDNSINFTNQGLTKSAGSGLCPGTSNFTASYAPVTTGGVAVNVQ